MRPINDERIITEYVRVHRLFDGVDLFESQIAPFGEDVADRLRQGVNLAGRWWNREWLLGNVEARLDADREIAVVSGQFGWYSEAPTQDAPPPYDRTAHRWSTEPTKRRNGVLALFALDVNSQIAAVTSLAGDVSVPGFSKALTDLLNRAERDAAATEAGRSTREWLVEPVDERGTFEAWVDSVARVTRVTARFHLPNPRSNDDLDPVVNYLNELGASKGSIAASNENGLDPYGHPMMKSAIAMQENDYGTVRAKGYRSSGEESLFASRDHPVRDIINFDPRDSILSMAGVAVLILRRLADRLERGLR
ncbi:MAG: hypothetical protein AB7Q42_12915 [Acidimicrobiia bacterium]